MASPVGALKRPKLKAAMRAVKMCTAALNSATTINRADLREPTGGAEPAGLEGSPGRASRAQPQLRA
eukprot:3851158-Alexandrium_andersonii.AAC.1